MCRRRLLLFRVRGLTDSIPFTGFGHAHRVPRRRRIFSGLAVRGEAWTPRIPRPWGGCCQANQAGEKIFLQVVRSAVHRSHRFDVTVPRIRLLEHPPWEMQVSPPRFQSKEGSRSLLGLTCCSKRQLVQLSRVGLLLLAVDREFFPEPPWMATYGINGSPPSPTRRPQSMDHERGSMRCGACELQLRAWNSAPGGWLPRQSLSSRRPGLALPSLPSPDRAHAQIFTVT